MILPVDSVDISAYSISELIRLRDRINKSLPSGELEDLDLGQELVNVYLSAKEMLEEARDDDETPLSQKATTVNSITSALKALADIQKALYSSERQRKLENALSEALVKFPELQEQFFDVYEKALEV